MSTLYPHIEHLGKNNIPLPMAELRAKDPDFCQRLVEDFRFGADGSLPPGGQRLDKVVADRLELLLKLIEEELAAANEDYEVRMREDIQKNNRIIKERDAAIVRLTEWENAGLVNSKENADLINNWIMNASELKGAKGRFTPQTIDIAISFLGKKGSNQLEWGPPKSATPPPPPAAPVVEYLPNGEVRLPLGTQPQRHHSVAQLRDLDKRTREAKGRVSDGWHGGGSL